MLYLEAVWMRGCLGLSEGRLNDAFMGYGRVEDVAFGATRPISFFPYSLLKDPNDGHFSRQCYNVVDENYSTAP